MFFGIFVLNRVSILSIFVLNRVSFLRQEPITLFLDDKQPARMFYECLKLAIKNRNSVLNRAGKSAIFVLNRVRAEPHLPTQGYIEYPPPSLPGHSLLLEGPLSTFRSVRLALWILEPSNDCGSGKRWKEGTSRFNIFRFTSVKLAWPYYILLITAKHYALWRNIKLWHLEVTDEFRPPLSRLWLTQP